MHLLLVRRRFLQGFQLLLVLACLWAGAVRGQGVELATLQASQSAVSYTHLTLPTSDLV